MNKVTQKEPGRNDPCPCGSGKKYKKCCGASSSKSGSRKPVRIDIEAGFELYHHGDIEGASSIAARLIRSEPGFPEAHALMGMCHFARGNLDDAKKELLKVDKQSEKLKDPNNILNNKLMLSTLEQELGNYESAEKYARDAINLGLKSALSHNALGTALASQEKYNEAKNAFQQALGFDAMDAEIWENLGKCNYSLYDYPAAAASYQKVLEHDPENLSAHKELGITFMAQNNYSAAIEHFELYLKTNNADASATSSLGVAYALQGRLAEGQEWLDKSIGLDPDQPATYFAYGILYKETGNIESCKKMFDKVLSYDPENEKYLFRISSSLEEMNLIEEAKELLNRITLLGLDSDNVYLLQAKVLLSRISYREKKYEYALKLLKDIEQNVSAHSTILYRYYFELGYQLDKAGEYQRAFSAYSRGNREKQKLKGVKYSINNERKISRYLRNNFTNILVEKHKYHPTSNSGPQPIFIVGFPRSGTTLLEQIVSQHSQIVAGGELVAISGVLNSLDKIMGVKGKFPEILDNIQKVKPNEIERMRSHYFDFVSNQVKIESGKKWFIDKMPSNLQCLGLITLLFPESPIIHIRRHPLSTCLSAFMVDFRQSHEYSLDINDTAACYLEQMKLAQYYKENLEMKYLEIRYEDLVNNSEKVIRQTLDFIREEWESACLQFYSSKRVARTASYEQVTRKLYSDSLMRHLHYEKQLEEAKEILEPIIQEYERA